MSDYEGVIYREDRGSWAFKIERNGCQELIRAGGFETRGAAKAECERVLRGYDPNAKAVTHYVFSATLELTVDADSFEEARDTADQEYREISAAIDALWYARNGAAYYGCAMTVDLKRPEGA